MEDKKLTLFSDLKSYSSYQYPIKANIDNMIIYSILSLLVFIFHNYSCVMILSAIIALVYSYMIIDKYKDSNPELTIGPPLVILSVFCIYVQVVKDACIANNEYITDDKSLICCAVVYSVFVALYGLFLRKRLGKVWFLYIALEICTAFATIKIDKFDYWLFAYIIVNSVFILLFIMRKVKYGKIFALYAIVCFINFLFMFTVNNFPMEIRYYIYEKFPSLCCYILALSTILLLIIFIYTNAWCIFLNKLIILDTYFALNFCIATVTSLIGESIKYTIFAVVPFVIFAISIIIISIKFLVIKLSNNLVVS